jgi:hypothetical protein
MQHLLCESCGREYKLQNGERIAMPRSPEGEPAEYERVVWGTARVPTVEQRTIHVNDAPFPMSPREYNCDLCNTPINPGERCCAHSAWTEYSGRVLPWEHEYVIPEGA